MRNLTGYLLEVGYWLAAICLIVIACGLFLLSFDVITIAQIKEFMTKDVSDILIYVVGSISFLAGIYFLGMIWSINKRRRRFTKESEQGEIHVSPYAIRDFVKKILKKEKGISKAWVSLGHGGDGVKIKVRLNLLMGENTFQLSQKLQKLLAEKVESGIGVHVSDVEVYAQSIGGTKSQGEQEEKEEEATLTSPEREDDYYG